MRNVLISAALLALPLAGCMPTGPSPEAIAGSKTEIEACYKTAKTHVGAAECQNAVVARLGYHGDLADVIATERIAVAEKVDRGKMSPAEGEAEFAKVLAAENSESQRRTAAMWDAMPKAVTCTSAGATTICY